MARSSGTLVAAGVAGLAAGWLLNAAGICPIVKIIWTPSWTLFTAGWTFLILAAFYGVVDLLGFCNGGRFRWWSWA